MSNNELHRLSAVEAVAALRRGDVSPLELVDAAAARIEATDGALNALPTRCFDRARDRAKRLMDAPTDRSDTPSWLGGLPVAIKDLNPVAGVRCTHGSPIYADHVPDESDLVVERLEANGAIVVAKSNTPEFGAGASTFNEVFGKTRNPWNTNKSVAGSSGGAAAALASGQVWLAQGSDMGGSLRTPASFNAVVGLRPSPGRVPHGPDALPFQTLSVNGPMGRRADDVALMLDAMCGHDRRDPLSYPAPAESYLSATRSARPPARVAFSPNLGFAPVEPEVRAICAAAAESLAGGGTAVVEACPDVAGAEPAFQTLRAAHFAAEMADTLRQHRALLKPEVVWNIEAGLALTAEEIGRAEAERGRLLGRVAAFFRDHDLLLCPTAIVPPFDVDVRYVEEAAGERFDNYVQWIAITAVLTLTGCPVASVPAGFTADGLPVGLQVVGPPRGEAAVLAGAHLLEQATGIADRLPIDPVTP